MTRYVSGYWEITEDDTYAIAYAVVQYGPRWNGWETPVITADAARAFVERQAEVKAHYPDGVDGMEWDGAEIVVTPHDTDQDPFRIAPDANGDYDLGDLGYTFEDATDHNIIRKVG